MSRVLTTRLPSLHSYLFKSTSVHSLSQHTPLQHRNTQTHPHQSTTRTHTRALTTTPAIMSMQQISTKEACPPAGPYSQAIKAAGQIWVAGQIPAGKDGELVEGSITDKTRQCIVNLEAILKEAGSGIEKVVRVGIFITDMADFPEVNTEYAKWFTHKPARSTVAVKALPKGVPVEIECIALA